MADNIVTLSDTELIVEPQGLDKLWSVKRRLTFPLDEVCGAEVSHDITRRHRGWRLFGLAAPGKFAGTFQRDGQRRFWNVTCDESNISIRLEPPAKYAELVLTVADPEATVKQINEAIGDK